MGGSTDKVLPAAHEQATESTPPARTFIGRRPAPLEEFQVNIQRAEGTNLGIDVRDDVYDTCALVISAVRPGPIQKWNDQQLTQRQSVQENDRIVGVNGIRGTSEELISTLKANTSLQIIVARPMPIRRYVPPRRLEQPEVFLNVTLQRTERLGIGVNPDHHGSVLIAKINDGPVKDWNESAPDDRKILVGDRIVEVNGVAAPAGDMSK